MNNSERHSSISEKRKLLLELIRKKTLRKKRVILASGKPSNYYIDAKLATLTPLGSFLVAEIILALLKNDKKVKAIGGLTLGADPIIGAVCAASCCKRNLAGLIVRKDAKKHGLQKLIEGPKLAKNSEVIVVEDVVTTANSSIKAVETLRKAGYVVKKVIAIVDRLEGGRANLKKIGCQLVPIFTAKDLGVYK